MVLVRLRLVVPVGLCVHCVVCEGAVLCVFLRVTCWASLTPHSPPPGPPSTHRYDTLTITQAVIFCNTQVKVRPRTPPPLPLPAHPSGNAVEVVGVVSVVGWACMGVGEGGR